MNKFILTLLLLPFFGGCTTVGLGALNATSRLELNHSQTEDIAYGEQPWQRLNVHTPSSERPSEAPVDAKPVIVFFYGGGWNSGNKDQYYFAASAFTKLGYVVVIPDYVKYPKGKFPTFIKDGAKAIAWTRSTISRYGGNPEQMFIVGHSAGAHLGALLVADEQYLSEVELKPRAITAFAGMAGPYNFTPKRKPYTLIFGPEDNYPKMKIMNYIDGNQPPMLLLHGTDDKTVGILNKDSLIDTIKSNGGDYGDITYEGVSHVGILLSLHPTFIGNANAAEDIDGFFKARLDASRASIAE